MIILYSFLILIAFFVLWKTISYIRLEERIRKEGISTFGVVTNIHTIRIPRTAPTDRVHTTYGSIISGASHEANFKAKHKKYRVGQSIPVKYLPGKPDKIVVAERRGYWPMLILSIALFLFVLFVVYKIDEMVNVEGTTYEFRPPWSD